MPNRSDIPQPRRLHRMPQPRTGAPPKYPWRDWITEARTTPLLLERGKQYRCTDSTFEYLCRRQIRQLKASVSLLKHEKGFVLGPKQPSHKSRKKG